MALISIVLVSWSVVSLLLYLTVLYVLVKKRRTEPFDNAFFSLFLSLGVVDIISAFNLNIYLLFRFWGWINFEPIFTHRSLGWLARACAYAILNFANFNQFVAVFWVAVNRYFTITQQQGRWSKLLHRIALGTQWGCSIMIGCLWLTKDYVAIPVLVGDANSTESYTYLSAACTDNAFVDTYDIIVYGITWNVIAVVIAALYTKCYLYVREQQLEHNLQLTTAHKSNIKLALLGLTVFILMVAINGLYNLGDVVDIGVELEPFEFMFYVCQLSFSLVNPWLLLLCSKPTRHQFRLLFFADVVVHPATSLARHPVRSHRASRH